jgi:hypothetical protein
VPLPWRALAAAAEHDIGEGRRHAQAAQPPSMARGGQPLQKVLNTSLAQNEPKGAKQDALLARIEKLTTRENERHERKMAQLEASAQAAGAGETKSEKQAAAEPASEKADEKGSVR